MFGGRQLAATWGSFAVGCLLVTLLERPGTASDRPAAAAAPESELHANVGRNPFDVSSPIEQRVIAAATRWGLDPALVLAVVQAESGRSPDAVSPKGAVGLMQLLPETAAEVGLPETADPADPAANLDAGCRYLASLLASFGGDVELSLAAYNAGPGAVRAWGTVPPYRETRTFVARVAVAYQRLTGSDLAGASRLSTDPSTFL